MRSYIFTDADRRRLNAWLKDGVEDDATRMLFVLARRDVHRLKNDVALLSEMINKLIADGRWVRRTTLPRKLSRGIQTAMDQAKGKV
jgi:hypothetical protein